MLTSEQWDFIEMALEDVWYEDELRASTLAAVREARQQSEPENDGRRWWRLSKDGESRPLCITIAELEWYWLRGWRPEYPLQTEPLYQTERGNDERAALG